MHLATTSMIWQYHEDNQNSSMRSANSLNQLSLRRGAKEQAQRVVRGGKKKVERGVKEGESDWRDRKGRRTEKVQGRGDKKRREKHREQIKRSFSLLLSLSSFFLAKKSLSAQGETLGGGERGRMSGRNSIRIVLTHHTDFPNPGFMLLFCI